MDGVAYVYCYPQYHAIIYNNADAYDKRHLYGFADHIPDPYYFTHKDSYDCTYFYPHSNPVKYGLADSDSDVYRYTDLHNNADIYLHHLRGI